MKPGFGNKIIILALVLIPVVTNLKHATGQTTMGILPVSVSAVSSTVQDSWQWQWISSQLHDYLVMQLAGLGNVSKLSREHILLLLKEMPVPDPENLDPEAYRIICKKEKLQYLLKCTVESIQVSGNNVLAPVRVIILDGNTGKLFWEDTVTKNRAVSDPFINDQILLNEVFKPTVLELSKEILVLKY